MSAADQLPHPNIQVNPTTKKHPFIADEMVARVAHEYAEAKENSKRWGEIASVLREELLEAVPEGETYEIVEAASGAIVGSILEVQSKRFDVNRFRADHPEMDLDKYYVASVSRQVRTK